MSEYFTAVFKISDRAKFTELAQQITKSMAEQSEISGAVVTGAGWCDEMTNADRMRDWLDTHGEDSAAIERGDY